MNLVLIITMHAEKSTTEVSGFYGTFWAWDHYQFSSDLSVQRSPQDGYLNLVPGVRAYLYLRA